MPFSTRDAERLYGIDAWGAGFFRVNPKGNLSVHPYRDDRGIDLLQLTHRLKRRKVRFPALLRFPQILAARVDEVFDAFNRAIEEFGYDGVYRGVYPIKVNQQREVIDELVRAGRGHDMGLEAGSKAELAVALAYRLDRKALVICNGYKDKPYVRLALRGVALGRRVVLIVEKPQEIPLILDVAKETGIKPLIGMRIRLRARGSGKWEKSGGTMAKFGLSTQEVLDAVEALRDADLLDCVPTPPLPRGLARSRRSSASRMLSRRAPGSTPSSAPTAATCGTSTSAAASGSTTTARGPRSTPA